MVANLSQNLLQILSLTHLWCNYWIWLGASDETNNENIFWSLENYQVWNQNMCEIQTQEYELDNNILKL